jgi:hypothetical protein
MMHTHTDFDAAFTTGAAFRSSSSGIVYLAGPILPLQPFRTKTGRIVICDPVDVQYFATSPLAREVKPGTYPAYLAGATFCDGRRRVTTCAKIEFSAEPVVEWQFASPAHDSPDPLDPAGGVGFQMASGISAFADQELVADPRRLEFARGFLTWWDQHVFKPRPQWLLGEYVDQCFPASNALAFQSGQSDDVAHGWWGLSEQGNIAQLAIDFGVLTEGVYGDDDYPLSHFSAAAVKVLVQGKEYIVRLQPGEEPRSFTLDVQTDPASDFDLSVRLFRFPDSREEIPTGMCSSADCHQTFATLDAQTLRSGVVRFSRFLKEQQMERVA